MPESIVVAKISDAFGVRGQLKIRPNLDDLAILIQRKQWTLCTPELGRRQYNVSACRVHGQFLVATLESIDDRDKALALKNADIEIPYSALPRLSEDEYYWLDLIGLRVVDSDASVYGHITEVMETGANDVFVVKGDSTHLIPYISDVVRNIDLKKGIVLVDWFQEF